MRLCGVYDTYRPMSNFVGQNHSEYDIFIFTAAIKTEGLVKMFWNEVEKYNEFAVMYNKSLLVELE
jgi:hypothetical protein